jgi:hypothetical protein
MLQRRRRRCRRLLLGDRLLEQAQPLRDRQHRLFARIVHDEHVQLVVQADRMSR